MLTSTFLHLPGIGQIRERQLWSRGHFAWKDLLRRDDQIEMFASRNANSLQHAIEASERAIEAKDADYFAVRLPSREHYRIALGFPRDVAFLDIETTGLSLYYDKITMLGVFFDGQYRCFVEGGNLAGVREVLASAKCIVTFNGSLFDLPFVRKAFPEIILPKGHVDLRFFGRRTGLAGGQKSIEDQVGLRREKVISNLSGENAPSLYYNYRRGDLESLRALTRYNFADVTGMTELFDAMLLRLTGPPTLVPAFARRTQFAKRPAVRLRFAKDLKSARKNTIYLSRYAGATQARVSLNDLCIVHAHESVPKFVGIDLTGSPARLSGWSLIEGKAVSTRLLGSDDDIVRVTQEASPAIVSIDSPLTLPRGRTGVSDDDPERTTAGITRQCERTLRQRGVNVYPCLIPSMQALTRRGIALADRFRALGMPVIESFPGAAQDIMGIPRKRTSLHHLRVGLQEFGLTGEFVESEVSHDELDAITSAVVGAFFWSGWFESLGNAEEDYLIIPNLGAQEENWLERRVIGFCGPIDTGKTTGANYLEKRLAARYVRFSQVLAEEMAEKGEVATREGLQRYGAGIKFGGQQRRLAIAVAKRVASAPTAVIDGLRFPEDFATMVERFGPGFALVYVDSTETIRCQRYLSEGFSGQQFEEAASHAVEQGVPKLRSLAHYVVANNGSLSAYKGALDSVVSKAFRRPTESTRHFRDELD